MKSAFCLCAALVAVRLVALDQAALVARADLAYAEPAVRSEEGMPVGNGRMGSLVWTTPSALKFQINRVDVFALNASSVSFPRADSDYAAGCGYVDINVTSAGEDVFAGKDFRQHLALHEALMTAQGRGLTARVVAWPARDVMAVEIEDRREQPEAVNIDLRMLRYARQFIPGKTFALEQAHTVEIHTAEHVARSTLDIRDGRILLVQQFEEREFYDSSAVAIGVIGRPARARYLNETTVQLSAAPGPGRFTILIASAASFDRRQDTGALALGELEAAVPEGFSRLREDTAAWWRDFWSRGRLRLTGADGQADFVEKNCAYLLYLLGASSRGDHPPRFGGMLWRTTGDLSRWGSQHWWANTRAYYLNLMPAGRLELMDPMFRMYFNMCESCALAARQQWGSQGRQRYQYTMDEVWLRDRAYPMIKGTAEFYRHFPNLKKEADGLYHIRNINNGESDWGSADSPYEVGAMHLIFPLAIRASEILGVDAELRPRWQEIKDCLPPPPAQPYVAGATGRGGVFGAFVYGGPGDIAPLGPEPDLKRKFLSFNRLGSFIDDAGIGGAQIFRNRLRLREGPGAIDAEHIAGLSNGVHSSLLDSTPADGEHGEPLLRVFPAWPKDWDADFRLLARGAFTVSAAQKGGVVGPVEVTSHAGQRCRLANPWGEGAVRLTRDGHLAETLRGKLLEFPTKAGERVGLTRS